MVSSPAVYKAVDDGDTHIRLLEERFLSLVPARPAIGGLVSVVAVAAKLRHKAVPAVLVHGGPEREAGGCELLKRCQLKSHACAIGKVQAGRLAPAADSGTISRPANWRAAKWS